MAQLLELKIQALCTEAKGVKNLTQSAQSVSRLNQCLVCIAERRWILLCSRNSNVSGNSRASQVEHVFQALDVRFLQGEVCL